MSRGHCSSCKTTLQTSTKGNRSVASRGAGTSSPRLSFRNPQETKVIVLAQWLARKNGSIEGCGGARSRQSGVACRGQRRVIMANALTAGAQALMDAYWRAANYLSVGQIYLYDNPLLRKPLTKEHIKPRLLGHWGTTPGLNFIYAHLNRVIKKNDLSMLYITGPGHGGPGLVANAYLEGTYSEVYPNLSLDEAGLKKLFKQFSFPGGIPSHVAPETPGSIHEGGELGYALSHAYGAAFDNPDLIVAC